MKIVAIDTETTGLSIADGARPFMVTACTEHGQFYCWEWDVHPETRIVCIPAAELKELQAFIDGFDRIIFHNALFDIAMLRVIGININWAKVEDTMLMCHAFDSGLSNGLKERAMIHLLYPEIDERALQQATQRCRRVARKKGWKTAPKWKEDMWLPKTIWLQDIDEYDDSHSFKTICREYATGDVERTMLLYKGFVVEFDDSPFQHWDAYRLNLRLLPAVDSMQTEGINFRFKYAMSRVGKLHKSIAITLKTATTSLPQKLRTVNLNSSMQLSEVLYEHFKLPVLKLTENGDPSTDKLTLAELHDRYGIDKRAKKFISHLLIARKFRTTLQYLKSYIKKSVYDEETGTYTLYPSFNPTGTSTVRLSSSEPNLQNVSKGGRDDKLPDAVNDALEKIGVTLRDVFGPTDDEEWFAIDYSQLQLRLYAYATGEPELISAFDRGDDFHHYMATRIYNTEEITSNQRRIAKGINFAKIFGAGKAKIDVTAGRPGMSVYLDEMFPHAKDFMQETIQQVRERGYITCCNGYRLTCYENHAGVNFRIQGDEAVVVKEAIKLVYDYFERIHIGRIVICVHDEIVVALPKNRKANRKTISNICKLMMKPGMKYEMVLPVDVERLTTNWAEKEPYA